MSKEKGDTKDGSVGDAAKEKVPEFHVTESRVGVWQILTEHRTKPRWSYTELPGRHLWQQTVDIRDGAPFFLRFAQECLSLAPGYFVLWLALQAVTSFSGAISLIISARLLDIIEAIIEKRDVDPMKLVMVASARILFSFLQFLCNEGRDSAEDVVKRRILQHTSARKLKVYARLDLPTSQDAVVRSKLAQLDDDGVSWDTLKSVVGSIMDMIMIFSQASVLMTLLRQQEGGAHFAAIGLIQPLTVMFSNEPSFSRRGAIYAIFYGNSNHRRMNTMSEIGTSSWFRPGIVRAGLQDYIVDEYDAARIALGDVNTSHPHHHRLSRGAFWRRCLPYISDDLPWILIAARALWYTRTVPFKALTLLEQSVSSLSYKLHMVLRDTTSMADQFKTIRAIYEAFEIQNLLVDGPTPYPPPHSPPNMGMKIEFRDVTFAYSAEKKPVLNNLTFTIDPGQLVVIVGENGCGKSSTIKLIMRLFDATKGEILIDDIPIKQYRSNDIKRAATVLDQDYVDFPLTIGENIGLGSLRDKDNQDKIREAARCAGALEFVEKLPNGFKTGQAQYPYMDTLYQAPFGSVLKQRVEAMSAQPQLSGGQWQRLALSRTFMPDEGIKLAIYDEPSASLDVLAEYELFLRLKKMKGNRTMIFITHRFSHLTKDADSIFYIKDGSIQEKGSHEELLALKGDYAHMYDLQARAFAPSERTEDQDIKA